MSSFACLTSLIRHRTNDLAIYQYILYTYINQTSEPKIVGDPMVDRMDFFDF
jgi:hypothetical protein